MHITAKDLWILTAQVDETMRAGREADLVAAGLMEKVNDPPRFYKLTPVGEAVIAAAARAARKEYDDHAPYL